MLAKTQKKLYDKTGKYPKGHYMGQGMGIGIAIGIPIGLAFGISMDNISLGISIGPGIGVPIGVAIGTTLEKKHEKQLRPLTKEEEGLRKKAVIGGIVMLLVGLLIFVSLFFLRLF